MKHFIRYSMAILPLLSLLAMSPSDIQMRVHSNYRSIASALPEIKAPEKEMPKLGDGKLVPKGQLPKHKLEGRPLIADELLNKEGPKKEEGQVVVKDEKKEEKKDQIKPEDKKEDKPVVVAEGEKKDDKKPDDKKEEKPVTAKCEDKKPEDVKPEAKPLEHPLIKQALEAGEKAAVAGCEKKDEVKPEDKKEEPKKEEGQIVVKDEKKEDKKEDDKKEKKEVCEQDEKVQALTKQVEQLLADQRQIMLTMMSMTQGMMSMIQNQQNQNPWAPYMSSMGMQQSPYQYQQPMTAGNWVYYPQGFQPNQINIFAQPQMQQQQPMMQQQGGIFPDQMHQQQSNSWGLQPQMNFGQAQPMQQQPMQMQPMTGAFGSNTTGFNMSPGTPVAMMM